MEKLRELMKEHLELGGMSVATQRSYLMQVQLFVKYFNKNPEEMGRTEIKAYLLHLIRKGKSRSTVNVARAALKYLYIDILGRESDFCRIPPMREYRKLPEILNKEEITLIFKNIKFKKYQAILTLIYSSGLRISEACNLLVSDIDSKKMLVRITEGKRGKDRYTILSKTALKIIREYWLKDRPKHYLFPAKRKKDAQVCTTSVRKAFSIALIKSNFKKKVSVHTLRHCFATHLLDNGVELVYIQKLLGHSSVKTTARYLHMNIKTISKIVSPLDQF
jgi:integrase/recombinase XerD